LGEYRQAVDLLTEALGIARDTGNRGREAVALRGLGFCRCSLGEYRQAIDLLTQALAIACDIGDRGGEANALDYLVRPWLASGEARRAVTLLKQAISVADATGDKEPAVMARLGMARAHLQLGDLAAALAAAAAGRELQYPAEEPAMRLLEGLALLGLHRADEGVRAFGDAVAAADTLLALAERNVAALQARALALSGLAARPPATRSGPRRRRRPPPRPVTLPAPWAWSQTLVASLTGSPPTTGPGFSPGSAPCRIRDGHRSAAFYGACAKAQPHC
jgi:tetratricopeptide (TPR) repeat protein